MTTIERFMPVAPQSVWDVLADPDAYGYWVVGSKSIRDAEPQWPEPGSRFHHTIGFGPFTLSDHTEALAAERPSLLSMRAKGRPLGTATVTMEMESSDGGTIVRMTERPDGRASLLSLNPLFNLFTRARNGKSLRRLEELALRRAE